MIQYLESGFAKQDLAVWVDILPDYSLHATDDILRREAIYCLRVGEQ